MRAPGCRWRTMPSSARPCRLTSATSCSDQPSRAAARLKAEGCGRQSVSSAGMAAQQHDRRRHSGTDRRSPAPRPAGRDASRFPASRRRSGSARRACGRGSARRPGRDGACRRPPARPRRSVAAPPATGRRRRPRRCRRWTASARPCSLPLVVMADPHARSDPRRHHGSLGAGASFSRAIARFEATLSLAGRTAAPKPQPIADARRRLRRRRRASPTSCASRRSTR